ncbi:MAG TPA: aminotransferase class V-fold PLP-dependent enzyme [Thermomicrobiaceae bacterium]|nr:aminotransferase class V-fold PLP-dependent enzyme [Thermomicrobiaceae bacterium]
MIYLDNAATSWPKPPSVYATLGSFLQVAGANPGRSGHRMATLAAATVDDTRRKLARLFSMSDPRRVIFAANATDALNLAIKGILSSGDHALTTVMEHNSVRRPLRALEVLGISTTKVGADAEGFIDPMEVREALRPNTRLVAITHASNVNGAIQPIAEIAEIVRRHGAFLLIDAAQTTGVLPLPLEQLGIDLLAFPGHKALMGPPGTGGLALGPRVDVDDLEPVREGGTGGNSEEDVQPRELPARYEAGTLNTVGIAALGTALDFVLEMGVSAIGSHEREMTTRLIEGLRAIPGTRVLAPVDPQRRAAAVSFTVQGWEPADLGAALDGAFEVACRTGLHCAPEACGALGALPYGTVRFSPGFFTTAAEIDDAVEAVRELAKASLQAV